MQTIVSRAQRVAKLALGSPPERKKARHDVAAAIVSRLGFRMYGPEASWFENEEFSAAWVNFPGRAGPANDRVFNLFNLAKSLAHVDGDLAECGVNIGRSAHFMLAANGGNDKHLHAFDSFEGLSDPILDDRPADRLAKPWATRDLAIDEGAARANLEAFAGRFTLFKGWIPDRFAEVADRRFSLVHVDVDLYEPTRASVEFFWPRINPGGLLVCDDYGSRRCPGAKKAMDEFAQSQGLRVAELSSMQAILFKPAASGAG